MLLLTNSFKIPSNLCIKMFLVPACFFALLYFNMTYDIKTRDFRSEHQWDEKRYNIAMINSSDIMQRLKTNPRYMCGCPARNLSLENGVQFVKSNCSDEATISGENQKVVSFSFFANNSDITQYIVSKYFVGIEENLIRMKHFYPGWKMRVYTDLPLFPQICNLVCFDPDLYFCNVTDLLWSPSKFQPTLWRFLPLGDPTVRKFLSRDLDSRIGLRETEAVEDWENSNYTFHAMRDYPGHESRMQAGMWGADNERLGWTDASALRKQIFNVSLEMDDQETLGEVVYEHHKRQMLIHGSYNCETYLDSVPFPKQRPKNNFFFVGQIIEDGSRVNSVRDWPCPVECRPKYGKDWRYC